MAEQINFSSPRHDGIELDHYQVIITDVTNQIIRNFTSSGNNVPVNGMFEQAICSPYIVTVEAHNTYGATNNSVTVIATNSNNVAGGKHNQPDH